MIRPFLLHPCTAGGGIREAPTPGAAALLCGAFKQCLLSLSAAPVLCHQLNRSVVSGFIRPKKKNAVNVSTLIERHASSGLTFLWQLYLNMFVFSNL